MWQEGNDLFLAVVDQNGAGSGEGNLTLLKINGDKITPVGCYYFGTNYNDSQSEGDYFESAKNLGEFQDKTNCSHWILENIK